MKMTTSLFSGGFGSESYLGDLNRIISTLEKNTMSLNPFIYARLSEVLNHQDKMKDKFLVQRILLTSLREGNQSSQRSAKDKYCNLFLLD